MALGVFIPKLRGKIFCCAKGARQRYNFATGATGMPLAHLFGTIVNAPGEQEPVKKIKDYGRIGFMAQSDFYSPKFYAPC